MRLCPASGYHVDELGPLGLVLLDRGWDVRFLVAKRRMPSVRPEGSAYPFPIDSFTKNSPPHEAIAKETAALVALKDWGAYQPLFEIAHASGVPSFAKVEGAQDFEDADVPWQRGPYTTADVILCQGQNDRDSVTGRREIVGNTRLERIWLAPPREPQGRLVVINLNFTWGVLEDARRSWLESAIEGCERAGLPYLVSLHPDERSQPDDAPVAEEPMSELLKRAAILVSRFSTVPFEAMARGVPFVYHNPHGESASAFQYPNGAFEVARSAEDLADALATSLLWVESYRERCAEFFLRQVDVEIGRPSEVRAADVIERNL